MSECKCKCGGMPPNIPEVRIGNDVTLKWHVYYADEPHASIDGLGIKVWIVNPIGRVAVTDFEVRDSVLYVPYPATMQTRNGPVSLTAEITAADGSVSTIDSPPICVLVPHSHCESVPEGGVVGTQSSLNISSPILKVSDDFKLVDGVLTLNADQDMPQRIEALEEAVRGLEASIGGGAGGGSGSGSGEGGGSESGGSSADPDGEGTDGGTGQSAKGLSERVDEVEHSAKGLSERVDEVAKEQADRIAAISESVAGLAAQLGAKASRLSVYTKQECDDRFVTAEDAGRSLKAVKSTCVALSDDLEALSCTVGKLAKRLSKMVPIVLTQAEYDGIEPFADRIYYVLEQ